MVFKRQKKHKIHKKVLNFFWPEIGIKRWVTYLKHRLSRMPGSSYSIAAGFAMGAAVSFTPLMGLHILLSCFLSWIIRANYFVAAIGTVVGNPWTFPFIWICVYDLGNKMLGKDGQDDGDFFSLIADGGDKADISLEMLIQNAENLFIPMLVGSIPSAIVAWVVFFFPLYFIINNYRRLAEQRRLMRSEKNKKEQE